MNLKTIGQMTPEQYWKWRFYLSDVQMKEKMLLAETRKFECLQKDLELARINAMAFKQGLQLHSDNVKAAKEDYAKLREELSKILNVDIKDCIIDEYTFEIKVEDKE